MIEQMLEGAPYALAMTERLRRSHDLEHEPANVFAIPASLTGEGATPPA